MKNPNVQIGVSGGPCSLGKPGSTAALGVSINRKLWPAVLLVSLLLCLHAGKTRAQSFDVGWFSIDGGGGVSSGGEFSISGIVGHARWWWRRRIGGCAGSWGRRPGNCGCLMGGRFGAGTFCRRMGVSCCGRVSNRQSPGRRALGARDVARECRAASGGVV